MAEQQAEIVQTALRDRSGMRGVHASLTGNQCRVLLAPTCPALCLGVGQDTIIQAHRAARVLWKVRGSRRRQAPCPESIL
jgi:hypothetical protein